MALFAKGLVPIQTVEISLLKFYYNISFKIYTLIFIRVIVSNA